MKGTKRASSLAKLSPKKSLTALAIGAALAVCTPQAIAADAFNGQVKGVIVDSQNNALSGTKITLVHKEKNITRTIVTNANGEYDVRRLPIGEYRVTIEKPGYEGYEESNLLVKLGSPIVFNGQIVQAGIDIERISVVGSSFAQIDLASSTGGIVVTAGELEKLPVNSGFESIALLAPGVTSNDEFDAASFGGGSSAENAYYLNGINITYAKTGIGSVNLPWEAIAQTEILTGGVSPEFGGALGGIVNAVSKSGSNEFKFGAYGRIDPESTREHHDDLFGTDGQVFNITEDDESTFTRASIWASGPIIEDKLFFYAVYAPQKNDYDAAKSSVIDQGESTSDRYFANVDWYITDEHSIGFTAIGFTNEDEGNSYSYDYETGEVGNTPSRYRVKTGGDIFGAKYTGILTDDLSLEIVAGRTVDEIFNSATSTDPRVWSKLSGTWVHVSSESTATVTDGEFTRDQFRADLNWTWEDHDFKFGFDYVNIDVDYAASPNGVSGREGWWDVYYAGSSDRSGLPEGTPVVKQRIRTDFTDSEVESTAFYIQDTWQVTDDLVLNLGLRYSEMHNTVSDGRKYVDVDGQWAPRVQAIYDIDGEGTSKVFFTYGRYYQPVSANMNITQGGARRDVHYYYHVGETDSNGEIVLTPDGSPSTGALVTPDGVVIQPGISEPSLIASDNIESMYSDEFTLGYERELENNMVFGIRGIYRDLGRSIEDTDYGPVINKYFEANGIDADASWTYVLANPGRTLDITYDFNGDGTPEHVVIPGSEIGLPKPERQYGAIETTLRGDLGEKFHFNASYTWSHSWGNTEGLVRSDNGQADPGWTTSYDYAELMDHSNGNLPNDRRHSIKLNGYYDITDDLALGFNARINSGMPINKFGYHPDSVDSCEAGSPWEDCWGQGYGHVSFYDENGDPAPRGSSGETDWLYELDMNLTYNTQIGGGDLMLKATIYNVFNSDTQTNVEQTRTQWGDTGLIANPNWGDTSGRLGARFMSFEARYSF
ncbi:TonB-dependent receptor [Thalassotalea sp. M1531]|uniref:TonB-dependent receptor n=1 Tax=Thalassotalea algicola TaxID=2716224 RepID=A0A7Y0Q782_9GAMM|nr:TonB-dependent receptor [Thalassotalea algicola]NMP31607.1 TonB-dependent receptor [Thalassotalea algicola]